MNNPFYRKKGSKYLQRNFCTQAERDYNRLAKEEYAIPKEKNPKDLVKPPQKMVLRNHNNYFSEGKRSLHSKSERSEKLKHFLFF